MNQLSGNIRAYSTRSKRINFSMFVALLACGIVIAGLTFANRPRILAQDSYPAPFVPEINPIDDGSNLDDSADDYPAPPANVPNIIGSDAQPSLSDYGMANGVSDPAVAPTETSQSPAGLLFLWGGFVASMLIFATAIVGSVVLFARRADQ